MRREYNPKFIAHRFGRSYGPDSSLTAFNTSKDIKEVVGMETDCVLTSDQEIVLLHDTLLEKCTDLQGWAVETPAQRILDAKLLNQNGQPSNEHPLSLEQGLNLFSDTDLLIQLEIKSSCDPELALKTADRVAEKVDDCCFPREQIEFISFWPEAAARAAQLDFFSRIIVACAYTPEEMIRWARKEGIRGLILESDYWSHETVNLLRNGGLSVMSGVCNLKQSLANIIPFKPDYISTDRPRQLSEA
jgi:glycerophosphoryl diester phosphodiesterase